MSPGGGSWALEGGHGGCSLQAQALLRLEAPPKPDLTEPHLLVPCYSEESLDPQHQHPWGPVSSADCQAHPRLALCSSSSLTQILAYSTCFWLEGREAFSLMGVLSPHHLLGRSGVCTWQLKGESIKQPTGLQESRRETYNLKIHFLAFSPKSYFRQQLTFSVENVISSVLR